MMWMMFGERSFSWPFVGGGRIPTNEPTPDQDPKWADERVLVVDCKQGTLAQRLTHVGDHVFYLFVENPVLVDKEEEILQEWLGRLFDSHPAENHNLP